MNFEYTKYGLKKYHELVEQGNDPKNWPVRVEKFEIRNGELIAIIEPSLQVKDSYQLRANTNCKMCKGHGYLRYWLYQDDVKSAPCHVCFPETAEKSEWLREATK